MAHRYALGDLVVGRSLAVPPGPYRIVRLLPSVDGEPHYHGRSTVDGHQRALMEGQIKAAETKPIEVATRQTRQRGAHR